MGELAGESLTGQGKSIKILIFGSGKIGWCDTPENTGDALLNRAIKAVFFREALCDGYQKRRFGIIEKLGRLEYRQDEELRGRMKSKAWALWS